jgi:ribose 5-phosphate isomerase B
MGDQIYIGCDHAGLRLKNRIRDHLFTIGHEVFDEGSYYEDLKDDYVDFARKVCEKVLENGGLGVLVCGTGQGMARVANKHPGIYAEVCWNEETARHAKEHSNANVLCIGEGVVDFELGKKLIDIWLETPYVPEERHERRRQKTEEVERKYVKSK